MLAGQHADRPSARSSSSSSIVARARLRLHQHPQRAGRGRLRDRARANRKPYLADEELEGQKLDRTLTFGLLGLFVVAVGLPLYWLAEPGRQDGARRGLRDASS